MKKTIFVLICLYVISMMSGCAMYRTRIFEQVGSEVFVDSYQAEFRAYAYEGSRSANPREDHDFSISLNLYCKEHLAGETSVVLKNMKITSEEGDAIWELQQSGKMRWIAGDHRFLWYPDKRITISPDIKKLLVEFEVEMRMDKEVETKQGVIKVKRHESGSLFFLLD